MYQDAASSNITMLLNTGVYPLLIAAVATLILSKLHRQLAALGAVISFIAGLALIHTGLNFPPAKALDYLALTAPIAFVSYLIWQSNISLRLRLITIAVLNSLAMYLLMNPVLQHQGVAVSVLAALVVGIMTTGFMISTQKHGNDTHIGALAIVAGTSAPVVAIGGSLLLGQLLGAYAATLAGTLLVSRFAYRQPTLGLTLVATLPLIALLAQAYVLADIPMWFCVAAALTLLVSWIATLIFEANSFSGWVKSLIPQLITSAALAGIGLWSVWPESSLY